MKHRLPMLWLLLCVPIIGNSATPDPMHKPSSPDPRSWYNVSSVGIQGLEFIQCVATVSPSLLIRNDGEKRLRNCKISYQYDNESVRFVNWSGNLATGETTVIPLSPKKLRPGRHFFQFTCALPNGRTDVFTQNNSFPTKVFYISTPSTEIPFQQGFQGRSFLGAQSLIIQDNDRDNVKWELKNGVGGMGKAGRCLAFNACQSYMGATDEFYLPAMNLTGIMHPQLDFQYAFWQQMVGSKDNLSILASTDCGLTWQTVWEKEGDDLATKSPLNAPWSEPFKNDWKGMSVDLQELANQPSVLLKFSYTNDQGNAFYLDNISLGNASTLMAEVSVAVLPELTIAPNPNDGHCRVSIQNATAGDYVIKVLNGMGQIVYIEAVTLNKGEAYSTDLHLYHLPSGTYPLVVARERQPPLVTKQILIQK
jgi:hypothetical protein